MKKLSFEAEDFPEDVKHEGHWQDSNEYDYADFAQRKFDEWYKEEVEPLLKQLEELKNNPAATLPYGFDW